MGFGDFKKDGGVKDVFGASPNMELQYNRGSFNPLDVNGLQLYLAKNNATPSSWLDQSPNAFDFVQATGTKQPTISANSVDFDGVDDVQQVIGSSLLNDSSGIIFFSGYYDNTSNNRIFASADVLTNNELFHVQIQASTGRVRLVIIQGGVNRVISVTNPITNGAYYYGYIESNDTSYTMSLNGVVETLIVVSGTNNGDWLANVSNRDNLSLGSIIRATPVYGKTKINKLLYSNATLTTAEKAAINNFMSKPANY